MRRLALVAAGLLAAAVPAAGSARDAAAAAPAADWSQRVEATAEGGYRVGNPEAPVKLIEFLSLTCGHCATFAQEAKPGLRDQVRTGRVAVEYRNFVLNHYDLAAAMLSRCATPRNYVALTEALLARQGEWLARAEALTSEQRAAIEVQPTPASVSRTAELLGLGEIAAAHGVSPAMARTCLSDPARLDQLMAMIGAAERLGINATPTFILNGSLVDPSDWASLQPLLLGQP